MIDKINLAISEIQQSRSRFQLEKFVIGQHSTPEMRYYQTCIELQDILYKYENAKLEVKMQELKIAAQLEKNTELSTLKAKQLELGLNQTMTVMLGAEREIAHLINIWQSFEHKYTRQEIEESQPEYWKSRLITNARAMISGGSGINPAHLETMEQAGILQDFVSQIEEEKKELGL